MSEAIIATFLIVLAAFSLVFVIASLRHNNSIVDIFWGIGFIIAAVFGLFSFSSFHWHQLLITSMVTLWGLRLSLRILKRNLGKPEDWRYAQYRKTWNPKWFYLQSFTSIFTVQAVLCTLIATPVIFIQASNEPVQLFWLFGIGLMVWVIGFLFESVGDYQLDRFIAAKPQKGEVLSTGLWRYSRHPNYFGEATQWWGIWLLALATTPFAWWTIIGPTAITFLLIKVTGVPLLEEKMKQNPKYQAYMRQTNMFIPGPGRSSK